LKKLNEVDLEEIGLLASHRWTRSINSPIASLLLSFHSGHFRLSTGAIWAEAAWGRYWGWDPKETWSFITWVAYAAYLHARVTAGWKGKKAAWLCLIAGYYIPFQLHLRQYLGNRKAHFIVVYR